MNQVDYSGASFGSGDVRVGTKDIDCEVDFVDNSLSRPVATGIEFEVFDSVICFDSIDVVDGFFGQEFSTDVLFHDVPMFEYFVHRNAVVGGNTQNCVATFNSARDLWKSVLCSTQFARPFILALFRAELLFVVDRARSFASRSVELFIAVLAVCFVTFVSVFAASDGRAGNRAVPRILSVFFMIGFQVRGFVSEAFSAFSAFKQRISLLRGRTPVGLFVRRDACLGAKASIRFANSATKRSSALHTDFIERHLGFLSSYGNDVKVARLFA